MNKTNQMHMEFSACSENEAFARMAAAAFLMYLDPSVMELEDVKTAVSEAVTNAIIHGYEEYPGQVRLDCTIMDRTAVITVADSGKGIENVEQAMQPLYTSKPELERSGMGFTMMKTFMDSVSVYSEPGHGTTITMTKTFGA